MCIRDRFQESIKEKANQITKKYQNNLNNYSQKIDELIHKNQNDINEFLEWKNMSEQDNDQLLKVKIIMI